MLGWRPRARYEWCHMSCEMHSRDRNRMEAKMHRIETMIATFLLAAAPLAAALLPTALGSAGADEGMWTANGFPVDKVENAYGFRLDQAWLDHVRLSSL